MFGTNNRNKRRLIFLFVLICLGCVALTFRVGWISIVDNERYSRIATQQQTTDTPVPAQRGAIYDRNMKELAISALTNTIWARPSDFKAGKTKAEQKESLAYTADTLSEILGSDRRVILKSLSSDKTLVKVAKYVDDNKAKKIRAAHLTGISIAQDVKRYYPLGKSAAYVLGSTTDDNVGLAGIELQYNKYLAGRPGRWIKNTDVSGDSLSYGVEKYFQAEDGEGVVLTIDAVIQHFVEDELVAVQKKTSAKRVMCLMMNPKTGDVLAMAMTPDFNPNDPRTPTDPKEAKALESMSDSQKMTYWNNMWRNPMISDTYEPGSTFKLLTTAIALEEGKTNPNEIFTCTGSINVFGTILHCWRTGRPHGRETLTQAVQNSCNPVFVQLGLRIGLDKYYEYVDKFGLTEKTGIDYPGEGGNILQNKKTAGPVGMATMSYGQGIAVTPISLLTAICALGNDGMLMQPRMVKELVDKNGKTVKTFEPQEVRQVISKETADQMRQIMESVVSIGGGENAKVPGYRVGGKTGTAYKVVNGAYTDDTYSSFAGMVPMNDPKIALLLIVDSPQGEKHGSLTAAPGAKVIIEETLRYMNVLPQYTTEEAAAKKSAMVTVPALTGKTYAKSVRELAGLGLVSSVSPAREKNEDFKVVDQYPKAGEKIAKGSTVYLYWK